MRWHLPRLDVDYEALVEMFRAVMQAAADMIQNIARNILDVVTAMFEHVSEVMGQVAPLLPDPPGGSGPQRLARAVRRIDPPGGLSTLARGRPTYRPWH